MPCPVTGSFPITGLVKIHIVFQIRSPDPTARSVPHLISIHLRLSNTSLHLYLGADKLLELALGNSLEVRASAAVLPVSQELHNEIVQVRVRVRIVLGIAVLSSESCTRRLKPGSRVDFSPQNQALPNHAKSEFESESESS